MTIKTRQPFEDDYEKCKTCSRRYMGFCVRPKDLSKPDENWLTDQIEDCSFYVAEEE